MNRLKGIYLAFALLFIILATFTFREIHHFSHAWIGYILFAICIFLTLFNLGLHYYSFIKKFDLTIVGNINTADGVGNQGINQYHLLQGLASINFKALSIKRHGLTFLERFLFRLPVFKFGKVIFFHDYNSHQPHEPTLSALFNRKNRFRKRFDLPDPAKHLILNYSMIESTELPSFMVDYMNKCFDAILVPDPFLIEIYKNHGVQKPIFCLPLIVNYKGISKPLKKAASKVFTFTNLSVTSDRKNTSKLIEAFVIAFKKNNNVQLVINSRYTTDSENIKIKKLLENASEEDRIKIYYSQNTLSEEEFNNKLRQTDCYVSPSKGEGFSVIPREAMMLGIPVVVTDNTGQSTIAQSGLAEVVKSDIICPGIFEYKDRTLVIGHQFDCTLEDLTQAMLNVYNNYQSYLSKSQQMRNWALQYSFDNLRPMHYRFLIEPKKIELGNKNELTEDHITTDSPEFYKKYKVLFNL
jgi:glycosyltransferase involved in cell wall biosynthesis